MADGTTAPIISAAEFAKVRLICQKVGEGLTPDTLGRVDMNAVLSLIAAATSGYKRYPDTPAREAATEPNGTLSFVYANNDDPEDIENGWWQADDTDPDGWVRAAWVSNDLIAAVQPLVDEATGVLSDAGFIAVSTDLQGANKIGAVADMSAAITALAGIETEIADAAANIDDIVTMAAGLVGAELTASRKAFIQVEKNRRAALVGSLTRFVSVTGDDAAPGRAMARAKATVAGLVTSFDYGVLSLTVGGTLTGGTPGTYRLGVSGGTPYRVPNIELRVLSSGAVSSGQNGWTRPIDGGEYAAGSAAPTLTIPAGANLPLGTVVATLGNVARPGDRIGFEDGGRWTEQLVLTIPGLTVASYPKGGKSRLPLFDCTDAIPLWTFDSGNVWSAVVGRAANYETVGGEDNYSLFQDTSPTDDMGANYRWMTRVASKAACNSTPDSYFIAINTFAETSATATVYVHAAGSVDPNTLKYRYNRRTQGVFGKDRLPNLTIDGISCVGPLSAQGSVNAGTNFTFRRACLANGGKHDVVFESGLVEDVVTWNTELVANRTIASSVPLDCIQFTSYRDNVAGLSSTLRRCGSIQPAGVQNAGWFYSHASGPSIYDEMLLEACFSNNGGSCKGSYAKRQIFRAMFQKDLRGTASTPTAMAGAMGADPLLTSYFEQTHGLYIADAALGSVSSSPALSTGADAGSEVWPDNRSEIVIRHNGYYNAHDQVLGQSFATVTPSAIQKVDFSNNTAYLKGRYTAILGTEPLGAGSAGIHHNILIRNLANIGSFVQWVQLGASFTGTVDWNVYIDLQANANLRWRKGATSYTFANWQAQGFDTHSVVLNAAQADDLFLNGIAGLANGDFRLDPACTLKFADGTTPLVGNAGIQEYYDWNARQYVAGQPKKFPKIPTSWAEAQRYAADPTGWDWYA